MSGTITKYYSNPKAFMVDNNIVGPQMTVEQTRTFLNQRPTTYSGASLSATGGDLGPGVYSMQVQPSGMGLASRSANPKINPNSDLAATIWDGTFNGVDAMLEATSGKTFKPNGGLPTQGLAASVIPPPVKEQGWLDVTGPGGSKFSNTAAGVGNIASAAGSLYGIYATEKNLKRQEKNDEYLKGRDAQSDARMKTFAQNSGGSY